MSEQTIVQQFSALWSEATADDKTWIRAMVGLEHLAVLSRTIEKLIHERSKR